MFIDTIMALWNRIWYGNLKRVVITSFLFGISIVLLLIMLGVPILSHSSPISKHVIQSVDAADKNENAFSTQPHLDGLSVQPPTSVVSVTPTLTVPPVYPDQQKQVAQAAKVPMPTVAIIVLSPEPVAAIFRAAIKPRPALIVKKALRPTATSIPPVSPTRVSTTTVVATPTSELPELPTTTPARSNTPTPAAAPAPEVTVTAQAYPTLLPEISPTPTSTDLSWMNF
jgi:hypothetical protein